MKRQIFAAVSVVWTGFAAKKGPSATISTQLGVAHNLHDESEFLCFNPNVVKAAN